MKGVILTQACCKDLLSQELKGLIPMHILREFSEGFVIDTTLDDLCTVALYSHFAEEVLISLGTTKEKEGILPKGSVRLSGPKELIHMHAPDFLHVWKSPKVNLSDPANDVLIYKEQYTPEESSHIYYGVRLYPDLKKRDYRIFHHKAGINSRIAFALSWGEGTYLDPNIHDGATVIERALYEQGTLRHFQKEQMLAYMARFGITSCKDAPKRKQHTIYAWTEHFADLKKAKGNAKIANVHKIINFARAEVDQIDYKCEKGSIACIGTMPLLASKNVDGKDVQNSLQLLFERASHALHKTGELRLLLNTKTKELIDLPFTERVVDDVFSIIYINQKDL